MEIGDLHSEAERLRSAEPAKAIRGFDEEQTRKLLGHAADLLEAAAHAQEEIQQECESLRSADAEEAAGTEAIGTALLAATRAGEEIAVEARASAERITAEAEARAAAIVEQAAAKDEERERESVAARQKLEEELAAARTAVAEENAAGRAELEREREQLVREQETWREILEGERAKAHEEAQARAEAVLEDARREVEQLQSYGERLRSLLTDSQGRFVELAESALRRLDSIEAVGGASRDGGLLDDLRPAKLDDTSAASGVAADSVD